MGCSEPVQRTVRELLSDNLNDWFRPKVVKQIEYIPAPERFRDEHDLGLLVAWFDENYPSMYKLKGVGHIDGHPYFQCVRRKP